MFSERTREHLSQSRLNLGLACETTEVSPATHVQSIGTRETSTWVSGASGGRQMDELRKWV